MRVLYEGGRVACSRLIKDDVAECSAKLQTDGEASQHGALLMFNAGNRLRKNISDVTLVFVL